MKTKIISLTLILLLGLFSWNAMAQVTVTGSASQDATYGTLGAAITAIGISQSGRTIEIAISAATTETASVSIGAGDWASLTIYPSSDIDITISGSIASGSLIALTGANKVTIDGRYNKTGASRFILNNTNAGSSTINFTSDAQYNTVKYCTIKGGHSGGVFGIISFSATTSITGGNGYNTIDHNVITNNGTNELYAIYAIGNITKPNIGNQITNNEFKDVLSPANPSSAIYILGNASGAQNDNFTISGNSFYQTTALAATAGGNRWFIQIGTNAAPGGSHTITDNYIGGRSANCGGLALTKTGTTSNLFGISIYTSGSGTTSIQGNTIQNISWTNVIQAATTFILVGGTGNANVGTVTGNTIGSNTGTGSITMNYNSANSTTNGIQITSTGTVDCQKNMIGSITTCNQTSTFTAPFLAITKTATAGTVTISNNIIGSTATANSIYAYNSAGVVAAQNVTGIQFIGTGTGIINNNTIANITNNTTTGSLFGIYAGSVSSVVTVNANLVHSLVITGYTGTGALYGIQNLGNTSSTNTATVSNNIVKLGDITAYTLYGISDAANSANSSIYHNTVYLSGAPTSGTFNSACLWSGGSTNIRNYRNNLLVNTRTNDGVGATGKHYALFVVSKPTGGSLTVDYNDYISSGASGAMLGFYFGDVATLPIVTQTTPTAYAAGLDANSISKNPSFTTPGGNIPESYVPASLLLTGVDLSATVTADYSGVSRSTTPTMGAIDFRIWNGSAWNTSPTTNYNAKINGTYSGAGFSSRNLVLSSGKQLSITSGTQAVANNFTILSDAANGTGTFTNSGTLTVGGATTVQQYITSTQTGVNGRNWYISSPLSAATSSIITTATGNSLVYYDGITPWANAGATMDVMKGYIAVSPAQNTTINFVGGTLNTGNQSVTDLPLGFNLVGNPYPSYVDFAQATKTNVTNSIWYRSKKEGAYNFHTYNVTGGVSIHDGTAIIPPMQSFWIKTTSATNSFGFTNAMRSHQDQSVLANRLMAPKVNTKQIVRLQVSNDSNRDETVIYFNPEAKNTLDDYDTQKMFINSDAKPEIYTQVADEKLVINGLNNIPFNTEIPVGFSTLTAGDFSISNTEMTNFEAGTRIMLIDKLNPTTEFELTNGLAYNFSAPVTTATTNRFSLLFRTSGVATGIDNATTLNAQVFVNAANQITIIASEKSNYTIYNGVGQQVENGITTSNYQTSNFKLQTGVYVVKVNNQSTRVIVK